MNTLGMRARIGFLVIGVLGFWSIAEAGTVYVAKTGNDANDGLSWATAKVTVQAGLDTAVAGDEVWVAAGTYVERIAMTAEVALYGGFTGNEIDRVQRNWTANVTLLDGNAGGSVVSVSSGATSATRIDGFTIRNGGSISGEGGGIYCNDSSPTIANNRITANTVLSGGGIYCRGGFPLITNNTIAANSASGTAGGILCANSSPTIANNVITANTSSVGSGIYCYGGSPLIANNTVVANQCRDARGGAIDSSSSSPTIANTLVAFNSAGVRVQGSGTPILRANCVFSNGAFDYSGVADPTGTNGSISANPRLADVAHGNMHIQSDSPCVNTGDDAQVQADWRDIDNQSRIAGSHVDIGADESDGTVWPEGSHGIVRVSPGGNDSQDGSSWALAKRTVQAGIDVAVVSGGEVWVHAGTYYERLTLPPFVYLYGGFSGTETARDGRDWAANTTILDGQSGGSVVTVLPGERISAIDGFTIRNGRGKSGGGVYCPSSSPMILNNIITGNSASSDGGGIFSGNSFSPVISNNTIKGNIVTGDNSQGGGISCENSSSTITNNTIRDNRASVYGGGIYFESGTPTIANNTIIANGGAYGGGVYCSSSSGTLANNMIIANGASYGGGVYCVSSSLTIAGNTIVANSAVHGGGGIYHYGSSPAVTNTIVAFNSSGICQSNAKTPSLRYNCVYGNTAYDYSGLADPTGKDGNISADPRLANVAYGNMHIQPDSPCLNAGDDAAARSGSPDIDGQARIAGSHVDIGADESDGAVWLNEPRIVRVSPEGRDTNDGSSWASTMRTVQAAVEVASAKGGEIWVRAGTYDECIALAPFAYLYGGFSGAESIRTERDYAANVTILDGRQAGSVITVWAGHQTGTIDGFTIRNGLGTSAGGGIYCLWSTLAICNNTITENTATVWGGGIYCGSTSATIANNLITGNKADGDLLHGGNGGGICCASGNPTITNNTITGNRAIRSACCHSGCGGGIQCSYSSNPTITNNTIAANYADLAGAIYCSDSSPVIGDSTITENIATIYGGGIYGYNSSPQIFNSTIAGNSAATSGGGIYCKTTSLCVSNTIVAFNSSGICLTKTGNPSLHHNCVYGNTGDDYSGVTDPTGTNGNLSADPLFVRTPTAGADGTWATADDDLGDLHLKAGSPCIDAGDNGAVPAEVLTDLAGVLRFFDDPATPDTGLGAAPIVDMGVYEYVPGDYDRDGDIDADDLKVFATCISGPTIPYTGDCAGADFDADNDVDQSDFGFTQRCFSGAGKSVDPTCTQ